MKNVTNISQQHNHFWFSFQQLQADSNVSDTSMF
jgi:hypothetical protein